MPSYAEEKLGRRIKYCFSCKYLKKAFHLLFFSVSNPYWLHVCYFVGISMVGMLALWFSPTKNKNNMNLLNAFYTSVSAATVSSLGAVPMQDLSELQLVVLVILMLIGGEVFTSMLCLHLTRLRLWLRLHGSNKFLQETNTDGIEMTDPDIIRNSRSHDISVPEPDDHLRMEFDTIVKNNEAEVYPNKDNSEGEYSLEYEALRRLGYISLLYLGLVQIFGITAMAIYFTLSSSGKHILSSRGIRISTFAVFTVVSSFANCGFIPLNENMYPFRKNHGLLLMIVAFQILLGNTMFAPCFRAAVCSIRRFTKHRRVYDYILMDKNGGRLYPHLFSSRKCVWLIFTVVGFVAAELVLLLVLHWDSEAMEGLSTWEKLIGGVFQSVAIRHAGENVVNPGLLSAAVIVLYVIMMYLPPYPMYVEEDARKVKPLPKISGEKSSEKNSSHDESISMEFEKLFLHDLCYLIIAVMLICITERERLIQDPLNFKVVNIVFEVASGYGNVGMSIGYSCSLFNRISKGHCEEVWYSFSGKWSVEGKIIIIMVMFLGRLKGIKHHSYLKKHVPQVSLSQHFHFLIRPPMAAY